MTVNKLTLPAKENAVQIKINEIIDNLISADNLVTTNTDQNITGVKTFVGQKRIGFKQSGSSDKLGFTLYNNSGTEKGYLEYNPSNTVDSVPLMTLGNYATASGGLTHVGFRKYSSVSGASGAYNLLTPLISDARTPFNLTTTYTNFYLPLGFTDGTTTVTTAKTGLVNISSLLPTIPTVDQVYDGTSANAQSGVAIEGELSTNYQSKLVSGTNIKTINNTSILGSGNIDTSEVFVAEYGVTTFTDIYTAYTNGKMISCIYNEWIYPLRTISNSSCLFMDNGLTSTYIRRIVVDSSNVWTTQTVKLADTDLSNLSATGETHINNSVIAILELMYPVGAIFIGTTSTCPMAQFFGTWELVAGDRVLQGSSTNHSANSTINASLPTLSAGSNGDHSHNRGTLRIYSSDTIISGLRSSSSGTVTKGPLKVAQSSATKGLGSSSGYRQDLSFDTNLSGTNWSGSTNSTGAHTHSVTWTDHVGTTVQPDAYVVNVWRRIS